MGAGVSSRRSIAAAAANTNCANNQRRLSSDSELAGNDRSVAKFPATAGCCRKQFRSDQQITTNESDPVNQEISLNKLLMWKNAIAKAAADSWSQGRLQASFKSAFRTSCEWIEISDHQQQILLDEFESIAAPKVCMDFNKLQKLQVPIISLFLQDCYIM